MYYSCVMNLIIPQWLRNRQWMKKVVNIELMYPFKHLIVMRIQCIVCFQNSLKQTSTFLVKLYILLHTLHVCVGALMFGCLA